MKKQISRPKKTEVEKKITFSDGLKIVQAIQKKVEQLNKRKMSTYPSNEYSL